MKERNLKMVLNFLNNNENILKNNTSSIFLENFNQFEKILKNEKAFTLIKSMLLEELNKGGNLK